MHKIVRCKGSNCRKKIVVPEQAFKQIVFKVKCNFCGLFFELNGNLKFEHTYVLSCVQSGESILIKKGSTVFGRKSKGNTLGLPHADSSVSRLHFQLKNNCVKDKIDFEIQDLESTNGSFIFSGVKTKIGQKFIPITLNDKILCGTRTYQIKKN